MSRQYHYLIAGIPDILFESQKLPVFIQELRDELEETLSVEDLQLVNAFYLRYDNENTLLWLKDIEAEGSELGLYSKIQFEEVVSLVKQGNTDEAFQLYPEYLVTLIEAYLNDSPMDDSKSWDLQLTEAYYNHILSIQNEFARDWFTFERDVVNLSTAFQCRKFEMEVSKQLVGSSDLTEKLSRSGARDFGITDEIPQAESFFKAFEEENLIEREKKIDTIKWQLLSEQTFFHYFTVEFIFAYIIKLSMVDRWVQLDKETGKKLFSELIQSLENSYEFPSEFSLK